MGISLKKHNEEAYEKVKEMFKESNKAAVVHPTGTGKTYIALKWIEESQGKTIYVAPSNHILNQVKEDIEKARENGEISEEQYKRYKEVKYVTYTSLMELSKIESGYANIILDEFHRCGAPEWGKGVERIIKESPNAKVLGMTATPVRAVDNKDMSDELFGGNIASEMTLEEAVAEGIIEVPVYVTAIYSLEGAIKEAESKVEKEPDEAVRKEALKDIEEAKRYLEQAEGMDDIFAKYVEDKKEGKYIVFCSDIDDMHKKMQEASKWFDKVGETRLYEVSYRKSEELTEDTIQRFREEKGKINLLFSVDKLNEGIHVDGIDGVIMLRKTVSPIIYMQQLGRALSAGNEGTPIVFDLVNNIDSSRYIYEFMERVQQIRREKGIEDKDIGNLKIYDEQRKIKEILERINEKLGRSSVSKLIKLLEKLKEAGVDVSKLPRSGKKDKTLLKNIKAQDEEGNEVDISEIVEKMPDAYNIGIQVNRALQAAKGNGDCKITEEETEKLIGFGLITREEIEKSKAGIKEESAVSKLIKLLEQLKEVGVDISKLPRGNSSKNTLLKNIKAKDEEGNEVDISEIVKEMPDDYNIGRQVYQALKAAKGNGDYKITEEETEKLIGLGLITREEIEKAKAGIKEESAVSKLIKLLEKLKEAGVDVSKLPRSGQGDKTLLKNIKAQDEEGNELDISEIVEEMPDDYNIGEQMATALQAAKGRGRYKITEEETEKLIGFGLITREEIEKAKAGIKEESAVSKLIKLLEQLKEVGVDVSKLPKSSKLLKDIKTQDEEGNEVDISEIVKEMPDDYNIGKQITNILQAAKGNGSYKIEDEEIEKLIGLGLITREEIEKAKAKAKAGIKEESAVSKLIKLLEKIKEAGVDVSKLPRSGKKDKTLLKNIKVYDEEGKEVDISEIVKEMPDDYNIGQQIANALRAAKGNGTYKITEEETEKLIEFGLITREKIEKAKVGIKEESAITKLIKLLEKLKEAGVDVSKLPRSGQGDKTLLKNIKAQDEEGNELDISEIVEEMPDDYNIGRQMCVALRVAKGKQGKITEEETEKLIGLGLITREEIEKARLKKDKDGKRAILDEQIEREQELKAKIREAKKLENNFEQKLESNEQKGDSDIGDDSK